MLLSNSTSFKRFLGSVAIGLIVVITTIMSLLLIETMLVLNGVISKELKGYVMFISWSLASMVGCIVTVKADRGSLLRGIVAVAVGAMVLQCVPVLLFDLQIGGVIRSILSCITGVVIALFLLRRTRSRVKMTKLRKRYL